MVSRALAALTLALGLAAGGRGAGPDGAEAPPPSADEVALRQVNDDYVRSFLSCDVARFRRLLGEDFRGVLASGVVITKAEFLQQAASPPDAHDFRLRDVTIRVYGEAAVVGAAVSYHRADGTPVQTRYVDLYVRRDGRWQLVSAQWTRLAKP